MSFSDLGSGPPDPGPPTPAATVLCLRPGADGAPEVLLLRRRSRGAFGGLWVFPGGKVDPEDRGEEADEVADARRAAVREAAEEAGIVLDPATVVPLSWWLPPPEAPRRFATWFFLAPVVGGEPIVLSHDEVGDHRWLTAAAAISQCSEGELPLAPPTWMTLWWLEARGSVDDALAAARAAGPQRYVTRVAAGADGSVVATLWEGDVAYDDLDPDPGRPGPRRRLVLGAAGFEAQVDGDGGGR